MKKRKGFGLLEVLLAGVILIIILTALVFVARIAMANTMTLQERASAMSLTQNCLENVRLIRDTNYIDGLNQTQWNSFIADPNIPGQRSVPVYSALTAANPAKYGYYRDNGNSLPYIVAEGDLPASNITTTIDKTEYTRRIMFFAIDTSAAGYALSTPNFTSNALDTSNIVRDNAVLVRVETTWQSNGNKKSITLEELMTNSRQGF